LKRHTGCSVNPTRIINAMKKKYGVVSIEIIHEY